MGPMNVRLENIQTETLPSYVSFLNKPQRSRTDRDSIHSVSSVRSALSSMSAVWSSLGWHSKDSSKSEKAKAALEADLKYLYSAFTKIPCLRLAPDNRARLIRGYEEFPFDTAVPLHSFKNLSSLEVVDIDFRSFFGWDRLAEQLRSLTIKRANLEDPADLLTGIVLDDMDKRRRRSSKAQPSPVLDWSASASSRRSESVSVPGSPINDLLSGASASPQASPMMRVRSEGAKAPTRTGSSSPTRPTSAKSRHARGASARIRRTGSGSSYSSENNIVGRNGSSSNLVSDFLPSSKWRFLRHLGLPDNSLTSLPAASLAPVADTLQSVDLSSNLFNEVPESLASLVSLRAVNLSHCMIESLHSLSHNPLPAITALNLRGNRLRSLAGIERLPSLERLDLRDNNLSDPTELARLTGLPEIREIWVSGNPFVKTHSGYRVVIFNLFRRTPGYSEDILIDGSGPGYAERKQLVDRVAEPPAAPVVRRASPDIAEVVSKPSGSQSGTTTTKPTTHSQRERQRASLPPDNAEPARIDRKKKRQPETSTPSPGAHSPWDTTGSLPTVVLPPVPPIPPDAEFRLPLTQPFICSLADRQGCVGDSKSQFSVCNSQKLTKPGDHPGLSAQTIRRVSSLEPTVLNFDVDGDLYPRKLGAIKSGVGTGWFAVLGDRPWEKGQNDLPVQCTNPELLIPTPPGIQTNCLTRANNRAILSGGPA